MTIFLIDRNVISCIKDPNFLKKSYSDFVYKNRYKKLKDVDINTNAINTLLCVIEGQSGKLQDPEQMLETYAIEFEAAKRFFKNAKLFKEYPDYLQASATF